VSLFSRFKSGDAETLAFEGRLPGFEGAAGWLNSPPLTPEELRGKVVLVDFWTYTCINWLRTLAWVRAWWEKYEQDGLVVIGVHTPEFPFERDADNVREAVEEMRVTYPVALDPDFGVWNAFSNSYWPAVYIADADGRIRHHHFGEGGYEECERVVQRLLRDAGHDGIGDELVSVEPTGFEVQADWSDLKTPETYVGYQQGQSFASSSDLVLDDPRTYSIPEPLNLNEWALGGRWAIESRAAVSDEPGARIAFRFHARDVNLVMGPRPRGTSIPFRVTVDGKPPGDAHGLDVDADGNGTLEQQRLYGLVREPGSITDRTVEITFLESGAEAYCFTFG
jgi:thiol-disulfide isomerase/thioredoxin